jgi:hypothetical protein
MEMQELVCERVVSALTHHRVNSSSQFFGPCPSLLPMKAVMSAKKIVGTSRVGRISHRIWER